MMEQIIVPRPMNEKKKGVFNSGVISAASFIGGPFICGWMLGENFKELGKPDLAKKYKIGGIVVFIFLIIISQFLGSQIGLGFISPALALVFFERFQKKDTEEYLKNGGIKRLKWPKVCIIFTATLYILVILSFVLGVWSGKQEEVNKNGQEAFNFIKEEKYPEAILALNKNITLNSNDSESYMLRGIAKVKSQDTKGAIEDFSLALTNKSNDINDRSSYYYRGIAYISLSENQKAFADFSNALKSKVNITGDVPDEEIYFRQFLVNFQLKNYKDALVEVNSIIAINPDYESATLFRIMLEAESGVISNKAEVCKDIKNVKVSSSIPELQNELETMKAKIIKECQ